MQLLVHAVTRETTTAAEKVHTSQSLPSQALDLLIY